jgi:hypothetical protein
MDTDPLLNWLLQRGGAVLRWRTASELYRDYPVIELRQLQFELNASPLVQSWLKLLTLGELSGKLESLDEKALGKLGWMIHGGKDAQLENVLGKLAEFGMQAGYPALDERMQQLYPLFRWKPAWKSDVTFQVTWETLTKSVFAWGLLRLGYPPDGAMADFLHQHLVNCHKIARDQVYDIYADEAELVGLPKAWVGKPIIKQEVMANYWLPYIHDQYVFANLPQGFLSEAERQKVDELITYIIDPRFQSFHYGYGYAWIKERRTCYGWGWSPHLPGYFGFDFTRPIHTAELVQRMELMAHFHVAQCTSWFQSCLQHLESFRTSHGTYCLPSGYLCEHDGYYVTGAHMGLSEGRRNAATLELESKFRMLKIHSLL